SFEDTPTRELGYCTPVSIFVITQPRFKWWCGSDFTRTETVRTIKKFCTAKLERGYPRNVEA
ncbi:MAG: hypothetical protein ACLP5V_09795, partial [Candidatus Bathyarchaeia archaeon]